MSIWPMDEEHAAAEFIDAISETINQHLKFYPANFVLIVNDGPNSQTFFAGENAVEVFEETFEKHEDDDVRTTILDIKEH